MKHHFRIIQDCPCPAGIAPYIYIVTHAANATIDSIYRGDDARTLLNKYGKHSQYQLYHANASERAAWGILGTPDAPGTSTHELKSDGVAYPSVPRGHDLRWWMQGFDVNDADVENVKHQAAIRGWELFQPYGSGIEYHHLNFRVRPRPTTRLGTAGRLAWLRLHLPRS